MTIRYFKYLKKRHLQAFLSHGTIRLGTLFEYRDMERYGPTIGDKDEGRHYTDFHIPGGGIIELGSGTPEANYLEKHSMFKNAKGLKVQFEEETVLRFVQDCLDAYIFCATQEYNPDVMREFGYDSCIEIIHIEKFFDAISRRVRHKAEFIGGGPIQYGSRRTKYTEPHKRHPAMLKDEEYRNQKEFRALWKPLKPTVSPIVIDVPRSIKFCRVVQERA